MDAPFGFEHGLDRDLFALDRLESLRARAPEGALIVQEADTDQERPAGQGPVYAALAGTIEEEVGRRKLHVHFEGLQSWAPEFATAAERVLALLREHELEEPLDVSWTIRVFSPESPVSLHGDGSIQANCNMAGRTTWHFSPPTPENISEAELEALMRGGMFIRWREMSPVHSFPLDETAGCAAPPRWPHWLEHPGPEPAVSFELAYWTPSAIRARKTYDVNWLLRKAGLRPRPPGQGPDRLKGRLFDLIAAATGKGATHRGL